MDDSEYEAMQEKIELFEEIQKSEVQFSADLGVSNSDARVQILKRIKEFLSGNCKPKKSGK